MNPNFEDRDNALDFEMVLSGINGKINMIEFAGKETDENLIKQAFELGQQIINQICDFQMEVCKAIGKRKVDLTLVQINPDFEKLVYSKIKNDFKQIFLNAPLTKSEKEQQKNLLVEKVLSELREDETSKDFVSTFGLILEKIENEILHEEVLNNDVRPDGRGLDEIRPLDVMVDILPRTHGSALFVRGQTQTLSVVTLGAPTDTLLTQGMEFTGEKRYIHHYNFPK